MLENIDIQKILPHRYPFLLVDRVTEIEPGVSAKGIKNVTINEPFFQGHFPGNPIMPGVLLLEVMAQVGAVAILALPENKGKIGVFAGVDNCRFKKQVIPGDTLNVTTTMTAFKRSIGKAHAVIEVDGKIACEADITFGIVDGK